MPLYVRDDRVKELADRVARLGKTSVTQAVRQSLEARLRELEGAAAACRRKIDEFLAELDAEPDRLPGMTDKDLYDENGDPIF